MSAPRWKPPNTELQIGGGRTSPYQQFQQMMPQKTAAAIQNSGKGRLMNVLPEFRSPSIHNVSFKQLNDFFVNNDMMSQNITTNKGDPNPWNKALWGNENQYGRRDEIIAGLGGEEVEFLSTQSSAWEPTVTTPSAPNNDELKIA